MTTLTLPIPRLPAIFAALLVLFAVPAQAAKDNVYTARFSDLAISGYDAVAYFTEGKPVEGSDDFTVEYDGAAWRFASEKNRDTFAADPARYAPQHGGYCAWAVSQGYTASTDPEAWKIVEGKLHLNHNRSVQQRWEQNIPGIITAGDANWPEVLE